MTQWLLHYVLNLQFFTLIKDNNRLLERSDLSMLATYDYS